MSQKMTAVDARTEADRLINGDAPGTDERLIGGDTGLAAVMARARLVSRSERPGAALR